MTTLLIPNVPIIISDSEPSIPSPSGYKLTDWKWFNSDNGKWYDHDGGWTEIPEEDIFAPIAHSHPTHGDINFTGTVSADGEEGLTGQRTIAGYTLTFKKGLLVGFQAP